MSDDTILQAIPNDQELYDIIRIRNVDNAHILGGTIIGDRDTHLGTTGEGGHGIRIMASTNVVIENVTAKELWGDGIYMGKDATHSTQNQNITVYNVDMNHNRRQGISITHGKDIKILNSIFQNTDGTDPRSGLDIEPNANQNVSNVEVRGNQFLNNHIGFLIANNKENATVDNVIFKDNVLSGNPRDAIIIRGLTNGSIKGNTIYQDPDAHHHPSGGIRLYNGDIIKTQDIDFSDNIIYGGEILVRDTTGNTFNNNIYKSAVFIRGEVKTGETISASVYDGDGVPNGINYQWYVDGQAITGATEQTYTIKTQDLNKSLTVEVRFDDNKGNGETATSSVTMVSLGMSSNQAPTDISLSSLDVMENQAGAVIGRLTTTDADTNDTHTYTVSDNRFEVVNGELKLKAGQTLEFANEPTVNVTVTSTDSGNLSTQKSFTLNVQDDPNYPVPTNTKLGVYVPAPTTSLVVNVKDYGAKGDGQTDDTLAIQNAINAVSAQGGGIVDIPAGTYMADAVKMIRMASNVTVRMTDDTIIKVMPNDNPSYSLFLFRDIENAHLLGGTLIGDRGGLHDPLDRWGHGVNIVSSQNVVIENVVSKDMNGDGFSIGRLDINKPQSENIVFYNVVADNNYRGGVLISDGKGIKILDSELSRTNGIDPQAAINLEPNDNRNISDVEIRGNLFKDNIDQSIMLSMGTQVNAYLENVHINDNTFIGNGRGIGVWNQLTGGSITGNTIYHDGDEQPPYALLLGFEVKDVTVTDNTIYGGTLYAEYNRQNPVQDPMTRNTVKDNTFKAGVFITGDIKTGETVHAHVVDGDDTYARGVVASDKVSYQWYADGTPITGATKADYTIGTNDSGKVLSVDVSFIDGAGTQETATSLPSIPVDGIQPNRRPTAVSVDGNEIPENQAGAIVGKVNVTDLDKDDVFTYRVLDPRFEVKNGYLKLKDDKSILFVNEKSVTVVFFVFDQAGVSQIKYHTIKIVDDPNFEGQANQAPTDILLSNTTVMENRPEAIVGKLETIDPDANDSHRYTLSVPRFTVENGYLKLRAGQTLNYPEDRIISLTVTSTDDAGASVRKTFRIEVQDDPNYPAPIPNNAPTDILLSSQDVMENQDGIIIGRLTTIDADPRDRHTYKVSDDRFEIVGNELKLKAGQTLEFANEPTVNITVTTNDGNGGTFDKAFTLNVQDDPSYPTPKPLDTTPPTLSIRTEHSKLNVGDSTTLTFSFSEPVQDFSLDDITSYSGTVSSLRQVDSTTYVATYTSIASGTVEVDVGTFSDNAFNPNTMSASTHIDAVTKGTVTVYGIPKVGNNLIATIIDGGGIENPVYQWYTDGVPVTGTNGSIYAITQGDVGKIISVQVNYTDGEGNTKQVSNATVPTQDSTAHLFRNINELMSANLNDGTKASIMDFNHVNDNLNIDYIITNTLPTDGIANRIAVPLANGNYAIPQIDDFALPVQNSQANIEAMLAVARTYVDAGDKLVWNGSGQTPLNTTGTPASSKTPDGKDAFAITCSTFINMVLSGWKYDDTTYVSDENISSYGWGVDLANDRPQGDSGPYGANRQLKWFAWKDQVALYNGKNNGEENYQVGDILFFSKQNPEGADTSGKYFMNVYHSALYIGNNQIMHSAGTYHGNGVVIETMGQALKADLSYIARPHLGNSTISIEGTTEIGQTLKAVVADSDGVPADVSYQWYANNKPITGATSQNYTLTVSDTGQAISVRAIFADGSQYTETPTSSAITPIPSNQSPANIILSNTNIMENQDGIVIGRLTTTDPDSADTHTYTVSDNRFEVVGGELKLKAGQTLEFANEKTVNVTVTTNDGNGGTFDKAFTLNVQDDPSYPATTPAQKESGLNLDMARHFYSPTALKMFIDNIADAGGTFLHLHFSDTENFALESELLGQTAANATRQADGTYVNPQTGKPFLSNEQIAEVATYAKARGVELIPELDMPSHIKGVLDLYAIKYGSSELAKIAVDYSDDQIDFQKDETKALVKSLIDEITEKFGDSSQHFHIGGDEFMRATQDNAQYIAFANELASYLKAKGLGVRMWNDAALKTSVGELDNDIEITYWYRGWDKGEENVRATMPEIIADGHQVLNYNGTYLYHLPEAHHYSSMSQSDHEMYTRLKEWHLGKWDEDRSEDIISDTSSILGSAMSIWGEKAGDLSGESIAKFTENQLKAIISMTNAEADPTSSTATTLAQVQDALRQEPPDYSLIEHPVYLDVSVAPQGGYLDTGSLGTQHITLTASDLLDTRDNFEFYIRGDDTDTLTLGQDWVATGESQTVQNPSYAPDMVTYHAYQKDDDKLWIDADIKIL